MPSVPLDTQSSVSVHRRHGPSLITMVAEIISGRSSREVLRDPEARYRFAFSIRFPCGIIKRGLHKRYYIWLSFEAKCLQDGFRFWRMSCLYRKSLSFWSPYHNLLIRYKHAMLSSLLPFPHPSCPLLLDSSDRPPHFVSFVLKLPPLSLNISLW